MSQASIPLVDLTAQRETIREEIDAAIGQVLDSNAFIGGSFAKEFEKAFAEHISAAHAIGASSGTTALHLALIGV